jgi:hypothetical protein
MRRVVTGIVVGLVMVVGAGTASAHEKKFGSFLTLDAIDKRDAAGTVGSPKNSCVRKRDVKVLREPAADPSPVARCCCATRRGPNELNTTPQ